MAGKEMDPYDEGRSLREEVAYTRLVAELTQMQIGWNQVRKKPGVVPEGGFPATAPGGRAKLTLNLDAEVAKWFRAMGHGYQARMNHVLRNWMVSVVEREIAAAGTLGR